MARTNSAYVFIQLKGNWIPCGYLTVHEDNRTVFSEFEYGRKYLERKDAVSLDPVMLPLGSGVFRTPEDIPVFGGIRDVSPDSWGRHLLERAAEPRTPGEFEYLTAIPTQDRVGAIAFGNDLQQGPAPIHPGWENYPPHGIALDLEQMVQVADQLINDKDIPLEYRRFLFRGSSLGGAQPKAPTVFDGKPWIVKFGREFEGWSTCRIEHANMMLAKECGIIVPETKTLAVRNRDVYLIKRFDRDEAGNRIHYVSSATLLGTNVVDKGSYQDIAVQMRKYCAAESVQSDLAQLFRRMVFNILCNNSDDHLRNHGFLYVPESGWTLSPAFDIVPQPDMGPGETRNLTLGVGKDGSRKATLDNALTVSGVFGLVDDHAMSIITTMKDTFVTRWEAIFRRCSVPPKDFQHLSKAFVNHLR
ncbi:MAG: type II toxin-antitoxin system HipA family toxin [Proteobacteria bacterium]|nr:type II toxin-antitoxin system HipA family toxin [Pseudomonadota bacterium]